MIEPGLCGRCVHARIVSNRRGSAFFLCRRSERDARYARYPRLPVLACPGHEAGVPEGREAFTRQDREEP